MKVRMIRDATQENPKWSAVKFNANPLTYSVPRSIPCPKGTIIEGPDAWGLVQLGMAVAEDDECKQTLAEKGITEEHILHAQSIQDLYAGLGEAEEAWDEESGE